MRPFAKHENPSAVGVRAAYHPAHAVHCVSVCLSVCLSGLSLCLSVPVLLYFVGQTVGAVQWFGVGGTLGAYQSNEASLETSLPSLPSHSITLPLAPSIVRLCLFCCSRIKHFRRAFVAPCSLPSPSDRIGSNGIQSNPVQSNRQHQIATLGPASCTKDQIEALFLAGVDVFRLNFSHGAHEEKAKVCVRG